MKKLKAALGGLRPRILLIFLIGILPAFVIFAWQTSEIISARKAEAVHRGQDIAESIANKYRLVLSATELAFSRLKDIGAWMKVNSESIYGTQASPIADTPWGRCTQKKAADGKATLYLHVFDTPDKGRLRLPTSVGAPDSLRAYLLSDPTKPLVVRANKKGDTVVVELPVALPDKVDTVVVLAPKI